MLADALKTAIEVDLRYRLAVVITGGTILGKYRGQTELDVYCSRLNAMREKLQVWIPSTFQIDPQEDEGWKRLHATGVGSVQLNIEVWDRDLFAWICPGKDSLLGREEWIKRSDSTLLSAQKYLKVKNPLELYLRGKSEQRAPC
jgi:hypothetical protein